MYLVSAHGNVSAALGYSSALLLVQYTSISQSNNSGLLFNAVLKMFFIYHMAFKFFKVKGIRVAGENH